MSKHETATRSDRETGVRIFHAATTVVVCLLFVGAFLSGDASPRPAEPAGLSLVAEPFDPEVVLPARVDAALHRTFAAVQQSVADIDQKRTAAARRSLRAAKRDFGRSQRAVLHQVQAVVDPESEEESTAGPDSALAALNVAQVSITSLAGLFDRLHAPGLVKLLGRTLVAAQSRRAALLAVVTSLDPEGAGAAYADALADTVPAYTDEVACIQEALHDDSLTADARQALTAALGRSQAAEAQMIGVFGGGE